MRLYIVADDLTGANATSVLLAKKGFKASTFIDAELLNDDNMRNCDVVAVSTDSRGIIKEDAYEKVKIEVNRVKHLKPMYNKRIDSTLRGNIGSEIDAMIDGIDDGIAVVVASYPDSGRVCIGGFLLVNSIPLQKTPVARDPKCPVTNSKVKDIIEYQTKYSIDEIGINEVLKGEESLSEKIKESAQKGNKIIVIDAVTNDEIETIAKASNLSDLNIISVDPGPYTMNMMMEKCGKSLMQQGKKVFFAVGSVSKTTIEQIEHLVVKKSPALIKVDPIRLIDESQKAEEVERVVELIKEKLQDDNSNILGVSTTTREEEVLDLSEVCKVFNMDEESVSVRINRGLAEITELAIDASKSSIGAVYTSGGDVTMAVMQKLNVEGIDIKDEVIPLAVYGRFIGGKYPNMPAITKGGLIGEKSTLTMCLEYLLTKISTQYYVK